MNAHSCHRWWPLSAWIAANEVELNGSETNRNGGSPE